MAFPFPRLPTELQCKIVGHIESSIVLADPIEITTFKVRKGAKDKRVSKRPRNVAKTQRYAMRKNAVGRLIGAQTKKLFAIAQVNRNFSRYFLPIIYGRNRFLFDNVSDMNTFLLEIWSMRQYVRRIRVRDRCGWNTGHLGYGRELLSLSPAMDLTYIGFNHVCVASRASPGGDRIQLETFVRMISPFLRRWHLENESPGGRRVLDLVQFFDDPTCNQCHDWHEDCPPDTTRNVSDSLNNFRSLIARKLGILLND